MSFFLGTFDPLPNDDMSEWTMEEPLTFVYEGVHLTAPKGYITNLASVPRLLWMIWPPFGRYGKAAAIHDYLYTNKGFILTNDEVTHYTRSECDEIFLAGMKTLGVNWFTQLVLFAGVRVGGWWYWNKR